jgi:hypothetical protein
MNEQPKKIETDSETMIRKIAADVAVEFPTLTLEMLDKIVRFILTQWRWDGKHEEGKSRP